MTPVNPTSWRIGPADALLIVDVQNDFLPPDGALAVPGGNQVIEPLNHYIALFLARRRPVFASRDWHPANHCSFTTQGGQWPPHCVADTPGAAFPSRLELPNRTEIVTKANTPDADAYSAFEGTDLTMELRDEGIRRLFVGGIATEFCVLATVKDALREGFAVFLLTDAVGAVDAADGDMAIAEMTALGAVPIRQRPLPLAATASA